MPPSIEAQRIQILDELRSMKRMRRGQISEQMITRKGADGQLHEYGPYFVWQASIQGKKRSRRIPADQVDQAREDLKAHARFEELCEQLASLMEQAACEQAPKKNSRKRKKR